MFAICGAFDAALGCLTRPLQLCSRTAPFAYGACCVNATVTGASAVSIAVGVVFGNFVALLAGAVVCPIASVNMYLSRDYGVLQSQYKDLLAEKLAMTAFHEAAEAASVAARSLHLAGTGVSAATQDTVVAVRAQQAEIASLKIVIKRLMEGGTSLRQQLDIVNGQIAAITQLKEQFTQRVELLQGENRELKETAAKIQAAAQVLKENVVATEDQVQRLGEIDASLREDLVSQQALQTRLDQLMIVVRALIKFRSEDNDHYMALIQRFPGLALPV
jgi:hypothetical protein